MIPHRHRRAGHRQCQKDGLHPKIRGIVPEVERGTVERICNACDDQAGSILKPPIQGHTIQNQLTILLLLRCTVDEECFVGSGGA
jgi:hypothetical protein